MAQKILSQLSRVTLFACLALILVSFESLPAKSQDAVIGIQKLGSTMLEVTFSQQSRMLVDFYSDNIFRLYQDRNNCDNGDSCDSCFLPNPVADPPASMLVDNPRQAVSSLEIDRNGESIRIKTPKICLSFDRKTGLFTIITNVTTEYAPLPIVSQTRPIDYTRSKYMLYLTESDQENYYGGGVQNGRFSHRGEQIEIVNTNSWTDGGVASPAPFYWSTAGYALMGYTFALGLYDFGKSKNGEISISHESPYLDVFFMIEGPEKALPSANDQNQQMALLNDYYQLTGQPVLLPKFAFYEGHLNAYNRDYWLESEAPDTTQKYRGSILFEDGKYYKESQKDNGGIKESLNGEKDNYQFSARAVIDRYERADMPLGWILPNDGYGAGYGQTETLDGNIANLRQFGDYARQHGVEIGLWTQSDLHPIDSISALLQRDIIKEVHDAGVRVLKTDVAWVGNGYSFGLNGISDVAQIMQEQGNNARPFIISLDGWAGTQRYAALWTGDQTGGKWEYIRFHIPTYIGAGLSGLGNITSDMDGIYGGAERDVNVRDFEWKTFTPMQLNMDGWGYNPKYPNAFDSIATCINRSYLKLKSMLLPYTYSCAHQASMGGKPLMRALFLDYPNDYTLGPNSGYQYLYGPSFLVAPIYQNTAEDAQGNDIRNGIYLPEGQWIDYFTGETYTGGVLLNNYDAPFWKLPIFVRPGAIIPMYLPSNNPSQIDHSRLLVECYPTLGTQSLELYDDDGTTNDYLQGKYKTAEISQSLSANGRWQIKLPADPLFNTASPSYLLILNTTSQPKKIKVHVIDANETSRGKSCTLKEAKSFEEMQGQPDSYYFEEVVSSPNRFAFPNDLLLKGNQYRASRLWVNIGPKTGKEIRVEMDKGSYEAPAILATHHGKLSVPVLSETEATPYAITPHWQAVENADYYEIEYEGQLYSTIRDTKLTFSDLRPESTRGFWLRSVNADGVSDWVPFSASTESNPLEFAIHGITATIPGVASDPDHEIYRLFDFATSGDIWFDDMRKEGSDSVPPYVFTLDLHCTTALQELHYLPREGGGNGGIQDCQIEISTDNANFTDCGHYHWMANDSVRIVPFGNHPEARYIRFTIFASRGDYVAGREIYVFRTPDSKVLIPGDITQDGKIDDADLSGYLNYTGLRNIDPDFEGYVSKADLNGNGLIDAYDISEVATKLEGGIHDDGDFVNGSVSISSNKTKYKAGDEIVLTLHGDSLVAVNALSCALPYNEKQMQFLTITPVATANMYNMTNDRLHKDGSKVLYPTFVNIGDKETLSGNLELCTIRFKALADFTLPQLRIEGLLVDKFLNQENLCVNNLPRKQI